MDTNRITMNSIINNSAVNVLYAFKRISRFSGNNSSLEEHLHSSDAWMLLGLAGDGQVTVGNHRYALFSGSALLGNADLITLELDKAAGPSSVLFIEFSPIVLAEAAPVWNIMEPFADDSASCKRASNASELLVLGDRLFALMTIHPEPPQRHLTAHMLIQQMMLWWHHEQLNAYEQQRTTDQAVLAAQQEMEAHFTDTFTRDELAAKAGIASTYFSVRFKKLIGMSPTDYLERLRVHRASELLLQEDVRRADLGEIARRSGFRDPWYMSKRFRKLQGISPSQYRISAIPRRVASLDYSYTHHLIALGIIPCAARFCSYNHQVVDAAIRKEIAEIPLLTGMESEKRLLEQSRPQAILTSSMENVHRRFRSLAPVLYVPWLSMGWREHLRVIGKLFRKETEAEACIADLELQAQQVRENVHEIVSPERTISVFKIENQRCYIYGNRDAGCIFYDFLGYRPHPAIWQRISVDPNFHSMEISMRQMLDYAGDLNLVIRTPNSTDQDTWLRSNEYWRQFEQASKLPLVYLDYREWLHYDPINMAVQLRQTPPIFNSLAITR